MGETYQPTSEEYKARTAANPRTPAERAAAALAQIVAALAAEARIEATFEAADGAWPRRGSFADYHRQFPDD